jgi:low temperature requirement protein LtrA
MKGIELPALTEDFTADPVELFFDLAYVFAFSQLVALLINQPTWAGAGKAALFFALLWLPWQQLTWAANAISGNGRPVRILFLIATVVSIPMAASTSTAFAGGGPVFAIALAGIMLIGFRMQTMGTTEEIDYRSAALTWIAPNAAAILVLVVGSFYDGTARLGFWLGTVAIVLWAMVKAADGEWLVRPGHFAERHGLIIIIALGEVIVAIGIPVVAALENDGSLSPATISALLASGAFAELAVVGLLRSAQPRARVCRLQDSTVEPPAGSSGTSTPGPMPRSWPASSSPPPRSKRSRCTRATPSLSSSGS